MTGNVQIHRADIESEAWITIDKNNFEPGETVDAVLHWGQNMCPDDVYTANDFSVCLTDPLGNNSEIIPVKVNGGFFRLSFEVYSVGAYTLTGIYENTSCCDEKLRCLKGTQSERTNNGVINCLQICSACFFVGKCEVAVPKAPNSRMVFVPEKWEVPGSYKLISVYLKRDGKPVPYVPVRMIFSNSDGYLERELLTDEYGNVYFVPYMAGTYCLINNSTLDESKPGIYDSVSISTTFSFMIPGKSKIRSRSKLQSNFGYKISVE